MKKLMERLMSWRKKWDGNEATDFGARGSGTPLIWPTRAESTGILSRSPTWWQGSANRAD